MTTQQMYKELEKLYCNTDWSNLDSVKAYNQKAREYRKMIEENDKRNENEKKGDLQQ